MKRKPARKAAVKGAKRKPRKPASRPKRATQQKRATQPKRAAKPKRSAKRGGSKWVKLVERHGVMLASARGALPNVAEAVAGAPIVGGWWAHPKGKAIFAALSEIDDSDDIRCFKLVDGKITFAHRRAWPALVRLCRDGAIALERLAAVQQEHMPTGEHRNFVTPFPDWVDDATAAAADKLTLDAARRLLPAL
ncbi:MAG: hypothetical protein ABI678_18055 [Kofleriaceae bacterium]